MPERRRSGAASDGRQDDRSLVRAEFERVASAFAERTRGRFDDLDAVAFSRAGAADVVVEVGAGTGNFLSLFVDEVAKCIAVDLTPRMLAEAHSRHPSMELVVADGNRLPFRDGAIDLVASAQMLHHVRDPVSVLKEMRRVVAPGGHVLVVDQAAPERFEEAVLMNRLETIRDPSHAASRPPSAFRMLTRAAGLDIVDERIVASENRLSNWMWPAEFPQERIERVRRFVEEFGWATGMGFQREGDDWVFTRRRIMLLAER